MNIAVTGGTGYIGSNLVKKLSENHKVLLLVRENISTTGLGYSSRNIKVIPTDFSNVSKISQSLKSIDMIYHLAGALPNLPISDEEYIETNGHLAKRVYIASAKVASIKQFVLCSTAYVTWHDNKPSDEKTDPIPTTIYEISKLLGENLILKEENKYKLPVTIIRPGFVYGNKGLGLLSLCKAIKEHKFFFVGDGKNKFELTHIKDLIKIFEVILQNKTAYNQVFIVSATKPMSIRKIVKIISKTLKEPISKIHIPTPIFMAIVKPAIKIACIFKIPFPISSETYKTLTLSRSFKTGKIKKMFNIIDQVNHEKEIKNLILWYQKNRLV